MSDIGRFIQAELNSCMANGIKVVLAATPTVQYNSLACTGWFDGEELHCAIDRPASDWIGTFVHETCHKDQFLEKVPAWDTKIGAYDACDLLDMWLEEAVELSAAQKEAVISKVQRCELDAEMRSVEKIKQYGLPLDIDHYARCANVYVWFYRAVARTRKWITSPYKSEKLLSLVPNHFNNDYSTLPTGFMEVIKEMGDAS